MNVKQVVAAKGQANLPWMDKLNQMNDIAVPDLVTRIGLVGFVRFKTPAPSSPPLIPGNSSGKTLEPGVSDSLDCGSKPAKTQLSIKVQDPD